MKKIVFGTALLAVVLACVSCGSSPSSGGAQGGIEAVARKVIEAEYYLTQFRIFRDQPMPPDRYAPSRPAPTQGDSGGGSGDLNPMRPSSSGPRVINTSGGGGLFTKRDYYSRPAPDMASVYRAGYYYSTPAWLEKEAPAEQDIDRAIAAYEEALKMEPSGRWQTSEDDPAWMRFPVQGVKDWLEAAQKEKAQWIAAKPARERFDAALAEKQATAAAAKQALESPNSNPNSEDDFDIMQNEQGGITITNYRGARHHVVIPQTISGIRVTEIGGFHNKSLRSVVIPNTVTEISSFSNNPELTSVTLPNSLVSIGEGAFADCGLQSINIPNSVTVIGYGAFRNCKLSSVTLSNRLTVIGHKAFENNLLTSIQLPVTLKTIGQRAFANNQITSLTIPGNVTVLDWESFEGNPIATLVIPPSLAKFEISVRGGYQGAFQIGNTSGFRGAFKANTTLTSITLPANVDEINLYDGDTLSLNNFGRDLLNFWKSQGKRAGTYVKNGRIWTVK